MGFLGCVRCMQSKQWLALAQQQLHSACEPCFTHPFDWEDRRLGCHACRQCIMTASAERFDIV